jgi:hypothetical protein
MTDGGASTIFTVDTTNARTITLGNVGIGSTVPQAKLDVEGNVYFGNGNVGIGTVSTSANLYLKTTATTDLGLFIDGTSLTSGNALTVDVPAGASGYAFQVTQAGSDKLHIDKWGALTTSGDIITTSNVKIGSGSVTFPALRFGNDDNTGFYNSAVDTLNLVTGGVDRIVIDSAGNVGIGSSVPQAKLDVEGSAYFGNGNIGVGSSAPSQKIDVIGTVRATAFLGDGSGLSGVASVIAGLNPGYLPKAGSSNTIVDSVVYQSAGNNIGIGTSTPNGKLIVYGGNVGIGSTSPKAVFDVQGGDITIGTGTPTHLTAAGDAYVTGNLQVDGDVYLGDTITDNLVVAGSLYLAGNTNYTGPVKITVDNANAFLVEKANGTDVFQVDTLTGALTLSSTAHVTGAVTLDTALTVPNGGTGATSLIGVLKGNGASAFTAMTGTPGYGARWSDANTLGNAVIYDNGTNVGLGSTAPQAKLDVEGGVYVGNGNIGIGTASPAQKLDILGNIYANGNIGIGTASPATPLEVIGAGKFGSVRAPYYGDAGGTTRIDVSGAGIVNLPSGQSLTLTSGTITQAGAGNNSFAGNLGIGSTVPQAKLDIEGSAYFGNGNIGVGSSAPSQKIDVLGTVKATAFIGDGSGITGITSAGGWTQAGTNVYMTRSTDNVGIGSSVPRAKLEVAGNVYVSSGNIGIGTSVPQASLTVGSTGQFQVSPTGVLSLTTALTVGNGGSGATTLTGVLKGNAASAFTAMTGTPGYGTRWSDANTLGSALIYDNGVNVGIGSTVPQAKLDIEGSAYFGNGNIGVGSAVPSQKVDVVGTVKATAFIGDGSGITGISGSVSGLNIGYISKAQTSTVINDSLIYQSTGNNIGIGTSTPDGKLVVYGGNVGVGSTSPTQAIDVIGTVKATAFIGDGSGLTGVGGWSRVGSNVYVANSSDNVGIGSSAPAVKFGVLATTEQLRLNYDPTNYNSFTVGNTGNLTVAATGTNPNITLTPGGTGYTLLNGNVGISTSVPLGKLIVQGAGAAAGITFQTKNSSATPLVTMLDSGNVGINSTVPQAKLDLEGSAYFGNGNIGVGSAVPSQKIDVIGTVKATAFIGDGSGITGVAGTISGLTPGYHAKATSANAIGNSLIYDNGTNVGIGSTVPQAKLDIEGSVYVGNGNVGLGTSAPQATLTVGSTGQFQVSSTGVLSLSTALTVGNGGSGATTLTGILKGNGASAFTAMTGTPGYSSRWLDANTLGNALIYDNGTNVGIGSTVPQAKLDIEGGVYFGNGNIGIGSSAPKAIFDIQGGDIVVGTGTPSHLTSAGDAYITGNLQVDGDVYLGDAITDNLVVAGNLTLGGSTTYTGPVSINTTSAGAFTVKTANGVSTIFTVDTSNSRLFTSGNVGINSTVPQAKLDVEGSAYFGNGNIGVGSAVPSQKIDVLGTVKATAFLGDGSGLTGVASVITGLNQGYLPKAGSSNTINDSVIYQSAGNNIGIGSTVPQAKLDIEGSVYVGNGNVGLGTSAPAQKLDVLGNVYVNGNIGIGTVAPAAALEVSGRFAMTPSGVMNITVGGGITVTRAVMRIQGSGGAVDIGVSPQITAGTDGELLTLIGQSNANTVKLDDGAGLQLNGGTSFTMGLYDTIQFVYDAASGFWLETRRSNN